MKNIKTKLTAPVSEETEDSTTSDLAWMTFAVLVEVHKNGRFRA